MPAAPYKPYNAELGRIICEELACSDLTLAEVLRNLGNPISESTFYKWKMQNSELKELSAHARDCQGEYLADKALVESRTSRIGVIEKTGPKGKESTIDRKS